MLTASPISGWGSRTRFEGLPLLLSIEGEHLVVELSGELDMANSDALPAAVSAAVAGDHSVRIDIAHVSFLDSSGLRAILTCEARLSRDGVSVRVRNPSRQARQLFEITGTTYLLE